MASKAAAWTAANTGKGASVRRNGGDLRAAHANISKIIGSENFSNEKTRRGAATQHENFALSAALLAGKGALARRRA